MKVGAPSVILTDSREIIDNIFFSGRRSISFEDLDFDEVSKNVLITSQNSEILSLEQNIGSNSTSIILEIADPNKELELKFLKDAIPNSIYTQAETLTANAQNVEELESRLNDFSQFIQAKAGNKKYFLAYGSESDLDYWAGPFVVELGGQSINLDINAKSGKKVVLEFIGNLSPGTYAVEGIEEQLEDLPIPYLTVAKVDSFVPGFELVDLLRKIVNERRNIEQTFRSSVSISDRSAAKDRFIRNVLSDKKFFSSYSKSLKERLTLSPLDLEEIFGLNLHTPLVELITKFLSKIYQTDNVICLIPDVNVTHQKMINRLAVGSNYVPGDPQNTYRFLSNFFSRFGVDVTNGVNFKKITPTYESQLEQDLEFDSNQNVKVTLQGKYYPIGADESIRKITTVINDFIYGLIEGEGNFDLFFKVETDLNIIKIWKKFGLIPEENNSVVIFGEQKLISTLLYANLPGQVNELLEFQTFQSIATDLKLSKFERSRFQGFFSADYRTQLQEATRRRISTLYRSLESDNELEGVALQTADIFNLPIFSFNTQNSDILDLNHNLNAFYFNALRNSITEFVSNQALDNLAREINIDEDIITKRDIKGIDIAFLLGESNDAMAQEAKEAAERQGLLFGQEADAQIARNEEFKGLVEEFLRAKRTGEEAEIKVEGNLNKSPALVQFEIFKEAFKRGIVLTIKTLPYFPISNFGYLNKPSLVLIKNLDYVGYEDINTNYDSFLSGFYNIIEMKHRISDGRVYSEFKLVKDPSTGVINERDVPNIVIE